MAKSCPDCGASVDYAPRSVTVLEGTCQGCGHAVLLVPPASTVGEGERAAAAGSANPAACWECGAALSFTVGPDHHVESTCTGCETVRAFVSAASVADASAEGAEEESDGEPEEGGDDRRPSGPPRRSPRFEGRRDAGRPRWEDRRDVRPSARPCRQCGGVLQFTQNPDGSVTGSCASCGNEFSMQPREGGGERRGYGRPFGGGGRPRSGGFERRGPRPFSPGRARRDDDGDDRPRRRRRSYDDR
ncbi:MAG TPA: hypothetical protein VGV64_04695 [Thermoplasmata archaeon]|nr:hypothetical protein [Thermoplasmata archaeon]HEV2429130.1 hypothetical protein [Thermoplasmata archaeon]